MSTPELLSAERRYSIGGFNTTVRQDEELRADAGDAIAGITGGLERQPGQARDSS